MENNRTNKSSEYEFEDEGIKKAKKSKYEFEEDLENNKADKFSKREFEDGRHKDREYQDNRKRYSSTQYAETGKEFVDDALAFGDKVVKFVFGTAKDILEHTIYDIANNFHKSFKEDSDNRYKRGHDDFYDQYKDHK